MAIARLEIDTDGEPLFRQWKSIKLDGQEISSFMRGITIRAHINEASTAVIEVLVSPEFVNAIVAPIGAIEEEDESSTKR